MNTQEISALIDGLRAHPLLGRFNFEKLADVLATVQLPSQGRLFNAISPNEQTLEEQDRYHTFSLRRVMDNGKMRGPNPMFILFMDFLNFFSAYSSTALVRSLQESPDVIDPMHSRCQEPFSVLGKLKTFDYKNREDEGLYIATRPILIVPGFVGWNQILRWEERNTRYSKEKGAFFRRQVGISKAEYDLAV